MHLSINSDFLQVRHAAAELRKYCADLVSEAIIVTIELGFVEALNNIIEHAYDGDSGHLIDMRFCSSSKMILIVITDTGKCLPPGMSISGAVLTYDPKELMLLPEGSMGLTIMNQCFDKLIYQSGRDRNILALTKLIL